MFATFFRVFGAFLTKAQNELECVEKNRKRPWGNSKIE